MKRLGVFFGFLACLTLTTNAFGCGWFKRVCCCVRRTHTDVEAFGSVSEDGSGVLRVSAASFDTIEGLIAGFSDESVSIPDDYLRELLGKDGHSSASIERMLAARNVSGSSD